MSTLVLGSQIPIVEGDRCAEARTGDYVELTPKTRVVDRSSTNRAQRDVRTRTRTAVIAPDLDCLNSTHLRISEIDWMSRTPPISIPLSRATLIATLLGSLVLFVRMYSHGIWD
jgi:hypothetical protein